MYTSLVRIILGYPTNSAIWTTLRADIAQLVLYHLMGYTSDKGDDEVDECGRMDDAVRTVKEWSVRKEWRDDDEYDGGP